MTDIVERLRLLESGARWACNDTADTLEQAADEIERLWAQCRRLVGEVSLAHKDALAWMERAAAARREGIEALAVQFERMTDHATAALVRSVGSALLEGGR